MTAARIIDEIRQLPASEKAQVLRFVRTLDEGRQLTGQELSNLAGKLPEEIDLTKVQALKYQILAGFYGSEENA